MQNTYNLKLKVNMTKVKIVQNLFPRYIVTDLANFAGPKENLASLEEENILSNKKFSSSLNLLKKAVYFEQKYF